MAAGKSGGPRVVIDWGQITTKKKGKKVTKKLSSRVLESTATLFGLKVSKVGGAVTKILKTKKGNRVVINSPLAAVARRKIYATVDGKVWHSIPAPGGLSLAKAFITLKKGGKAYAIKFQGGTPKVIGKSPIKDTKSKAKAATTSKAGK